MNTLSRNELRKRQNSVLGKNAATIKESRMINEVELGYKESEEVIVDLINAIVSKEGIPPQYKNRGFEPLYNSLKPHVNSIAELYGKKKLRTSDFWREITGKGSDTSKTDVKGDRNYSVKYGPAQLMSGSTLEAEATFLAAAEKSGISKSAQMMAIDMLETLETFSGRTIGPDMDVRKLKKFKTKSEIKDVINKKAYSLVKNAQNSQLAFKNYLNDLFRDSDEFRLHFIYEAMTGESKFSGGDQDAIADTMLCIDKTATKVKVEVVTNPNASYVKRVLSATKVDVNFKTGSYSHRGEKIGYNFFTVIRLGTKDLSESVNELNEAIDKLDENLNEDFFDMIQPFLDKVKSAWTTLKRLFSVLVEYIKKGFNYILSTFGLVPIITGWEELDTIDLFSV
jgi:hypothetical protein